jgi:hypothetical protein
MRSETSPKSRGEEEVEDEEVLLLIMLLLFDSSVISLIYDGNGANNPTLSEISASASAKYSGTPSFARIASLEAGGIVK